MNWGRKVNNRNQVKTKKIRKAITTLTKIVRSRYIRNVLFWKVHLEVHSRLLPKGMRRSPVDTTETTIRGQQVDLSKLRAISPTRRRPATPPITSEILMAIQSPSAVSPALASMQSSRKTLTTPVPVLPDHIRQAANIIENDPIKYFITQSVQGLLFAGLENGEIYL